jgi:hypothetical protein
MFDPPTPASAGADGPDYTELLRILQQGRQGAHERMLPGAGHPHSLPQLESFLTTLVFFATEPSGWLRVTCSPDGDTIYLKWKWTAGTYQNKYVMAVVQSWQLPYGFALLYEKYWRVLDRGEGASEDRFYNGKGGPS